MIHEIISSYADQVMLYLNKYGQTEHAELLKNLELTDIEYNMALGWLLREARISIFYLEKKAIITKIY